MLVTMAYGGVNNAVKNTYFKRLAGGCPDALWRLPTLSDHDAPNSQNFSGAAWGHHFCSVGEVVRGWWYQGVPTTLYGWGTAYDRFWRCSLAVGGPDVPGGQFCSGGTRGVRVYGGG